jgi:hypothetical protein
MELADAFARFRSDRALAQRFIEDPEGVLSIMGFDTSKYVIQPVQGAKDPFKAVAELRRRGAEPLQVVINVCASVGAVVCASVGTDIETDDIFRKLPTELPPSQ